MIEIRWPSGIRQTLKNVRGDQILQVDEPLAMRGKGNLRRSKILNAKDRLPVAEVFFGAVPTILPEPSFKVWMVSADRLSKCSRSPLGQRTCTEIDLGSHAKAEMYPHVILRKYS